MFEARARPWHKWTMTIIDSTLSKMGIPHLITLIPWWRPQIRHNSALTECARCNIIRKFVSTATCRHGEHNEEGRNQL